MARGETHPGRARCERRGARRSPAARPGWAPCTQGVAQVVKKYNLRSQGVKAGGYDLLGPTVELLAANQLDFTIDLIVVAVRNDNAAQPARQRGRDG